MNDQHDQRPIAPVHIEAAALERLPASKDVLSTAEEVEIRTALLLKVNGAMLTAARFNELPVITLEDGKGIEVIGRAFDETTLHTWVVCLAAGRLSLMVYGLADAALRGVLDELPVFAIRPS